MGEIIKLSQIMANVSPAKISTVDALWTLIQSQTSSVRDALYKRVLEAEEKRKTSQQEECVKKSLTRAFSELADVGGNLDNLPDARDLFKIMDAK